jgi:hypothetical protein
MRGARYGFPGWVSVEETKRGTKRRYIEQRSDAQAKAIEYLEGAKAAGELAGRTLALLVMAVYAHEGAVAQSARAFPSVRCTARCRGPARFGEEAVSGVRQGQDGPWIPEYIC